MAVLCVRTRNVIRGHRPVADRLLGREEAVIHMMGWIGHPRSGNRRMCGGTRPGASRSRVASRA
jgi:hypothetical protein